MKATIDRVHSVNQYYDGPELGAADFEGQPHVYERFTERHDGRPEIYRLSPIDHDALSAILEDWQLYLKWDAAQDERSRQILDGGPRVLAPDVPRHLELEPLVEAALKIDEARAVTVHGIFLDRMTRVKWAPL
jgi:hypothetical protein